MTATHVPDVPETKACPYCGETILAVAIKCRFCSTQLDPAAAAAAAVANRGGVDEDSVSVGAHVVALVASLGLVLGPFLPWATVGVLSASGMQKTGNEALLLTLVGVLGLIVATISLLKRRDIAKWAPFVLGGIGAVLSGYYLVSLSAHLDSLSNSFASPAIGVGIYVSIGASILLLLSALGFARPREQNAPPVPAGSAGT